MHDPEFTEKSYRHSVQSLASRQNLQSAPQALQLVPVRKYSYKHYKQFVPESHILHPEEQAIQVEPER